MRRYGNPSRILIVMFVTVFFLRCEEPTNSGAGKNLPVAPIGEDTTKPSNIRYWNTPVGDFAPLRVGNHWVYMLEYTETNGGVKTRDDFCKRSVTLSASSFDASAGDSLYLMEAQDSMGTSADSLTESRSFETNVIANHNSIICNLPKFPGNGENIPCQPFYRSHYQDSALFTPGKGFAWNKIMILGVDTLRYLGEESSQGGMGVGSSIGSYWLEGIGLVNAYHDTQGISSSSGWSFRLLEFNGRKDEKVTIKG